MIIAAEILLIGLNILMAWWHSRLIKAGRPIRHGLWGGVYLAVLIAIAFFSPVLAITGLFIRKLFFDLSLNLFRDLPLFYVSSSTTSIIDKIHNKLFGNRSEIYMMIYLAVFIILNIYLCS